MEKSLAVFLGVSFTAIFVVSIISAIIYGQKQAKQAKQLVEVYKRLAERFGGTVETQSRSGRPSARFVYNGANVLVDIYSTPYSTGGNHPDYYTQVHVTWPDKGLRCEVYPTNQFTRLGKFLGMADVEIGSPEFDAAYQISGHDPEAIKVFLSSGVQGAINKLLRFGGNGQIYVLVSGGTLLVKKLSVSRDYREFDLLARYTMLALELFEQAILTHSSGIQYIDQPHPGQGPPTCQVCGESMETSLVYCRQCKTPHHADCWKYYGACSTYGCREREFTSDTGKLKA